MLAISQITITKRASKAGKKKSCNKNKNLITSFHLIKLNESLKA